MKFWNSDESSSSFSTTALEREFGTSIPTAAFPGIGARMRRLAARILPWTAASFLLIVPSGLAMFTADAAALIASPVFATKVSLILAAGANAAVFHAGAFRSVARWDVEVAPPPAARAAGALSLALWLSVIACGVLLAA